MDGELLPRQVVRRAEDFKVAWLFYESLESRISQVKTQELVQGIQIYTGLVSKLDIAVMKSQFFGTVSITDGTLPKPLFFYALLSCLKEVVVRVPLARVMCFVVSQ